MNIIVCVKQIPDPEIPLAKFRIDPQAKRVIPPEGIPPVISPFDEQAVEAALQIKEQHGGKITVLTMGSGSASDVVRHTLSMGADEGIIISDEAFEGSDSFSTAYVLTRAVEKIGEYDLIVCGRQAADWDIGAVGSLIAENLDVPIITFARKIEVINETLRVERVLLDGYEVAEVTPPAVVTVSNELGQPRLPSGWGIITAARKQIPTWGAGDLDIDVSLIGAGSARSELIRLFVPLRERTCQIITGESAAEAGANLALKLREDRVI
jgi:electron transfer flavoprotein beta subunit